MFALVQVMAWHRTGLSPLPKTILNQYPCVIGPRGFTNVEAITKWTTFAHGIFEVMSIRENCRILISVSRKYVFIGPIDIRPTLVQIIALCRTIDRSLYGLMFRTSLVTHICVTRLQWVATRSAASVTNDIIKAIVVIKNLWKPLKHARHYIPSFRHCICWRALHLYNRTPAWMVMTKIM